MGMQKQLAIGISAALETRNYEALKQELTSLENRTNAETTLRFLLSTINGLIDDPGMFGEVEVCHTEGCIAEVPMRKAHYFEHELYCEDHA